MKYTCREVDVSFLQTAPVRIVNVVEIDASAEQIFSLWRDAQAWPKWFKNIIDVEWTSAEPFGVGTTREVTLDTMRIDETFIVWENNKRFCFYLSRTSKHFFHALCEDYQLEKLANNKTRFTYTVAYEPAGLFRLLGPFGTMVMKKMFRRGALGLAAYMS